MDSFFLPSATHRSELTVSQGCPPRLSVAPPMEGETATATAAIAARYDERLMERIIQRRQHALAELCSRHGQSLRRMIGNVVHEEFQVEDVLQESFLQVWREASNYSPQIGRPLGWVISIARRRAIDRVRRRESYRRAKKRFEDQTRTGAVSGSRNVTVTEIARSRRGWNKNRDLHRNR